MQMCQGQSIGYQQEALQEYQYSSLLPSSKPFSTQSRLSFLRRKLRILQNNNKIYVKKVRWKTGCDLPNKKIPYKFIRVQEPIFQMPKELEVTVHEKSSLQFEGQHKIALIKLQDFLNHSGQPKASVVQQSIELGYTPQLVRKNLKSIRSANLWLYKGKRITNWHYDGHDNFLYQFEGTKTIYLLPPNTMKGVNAFSLYNNHALNPNESLKFAKKMFKTVIRKGQCLYIPRGWWHCVISKGKISKAVNVWGNSFADINQSQYENLLKFLIFEISDSRCKLNVPNLDFFTESDQSKLRSIQFQKFWLQRVFTSPNA